MNCSFGSLVPDVDDLLDLEVEELAGIFLRFLNCNRMASINNPICRHNFFMNRQDYPNRQGDVNRALLEAWAWLQSAGLLVEQAGTSGGFFFISRRGEQITSRGDFDSYRKAGLLPKSQIHPLIADKVYPAFLRGEYDTAVFQAFRELEVSVRNAAKLGSDCIGTDLMRRAFKPVQGVGQSVAHGPLTDTCLPSAEQEAMANIFAGAIGLYKNPLSHRYVPTNPEDAAEIIMLASQLLRVVDRLSSDS